MEQEDLSRRDFVTLTVAAGIATAAGTTADAQQLTERHVEIKTADGTCDAAFIHPQTGRHAGVIIWPDAFGLRPSMRDLAKRLAGDGYAVLVPNPFYRVARAPIFESATNFNFSDPAQRSKITPLMGSINADGAAERDAAAFVAWLDAQSQVDRGRKIGTQGYCMGGALVMRTAAAQADRIGAGASFHGGGLVTKNPNSPHLLAPRIKARMYFGVAADDDKQQPDAKTTLRDAFTAAKVPVEVELYPAALHGWCIADMPTVNGQIYNQAEADKAWSKLLALYRAGLA